MFKIYKSKKNDKLIGILKANGEEPQSFMIQNRPIRLTDKELGTGPITFGGKNH